MPRRFKIILHMCLLICGICMHAYSQEEILPSMPVSLNVNSARLADALTDIEKQIPYRFAYNGDLIARQKKVSCTAENAPLDKILQTLLKGTGISYSVIQNQIVLQQMPVPQRLTISGYIRDSQSGETLPSAIIYIPELNHYTYSNNYGYYSITGDGTDSVNIAVSYVGYNKIITKVGGKSNPLLNFNLTANSVLMNSVVVDKNKPDDNIRKFQAGKSEISLQSVKSMPSVNGTGDIIRTIEMMPGVMAGLDGRPGYFIRGGNTDQNLVQLDEATLYNPNHMLGLVGIFNSSAIQNAYLLKAGFPASFGDHLSSVLDVTMKEGNQQKLEGDLQMGTVTSAMTLSGPLVVNKASFLISARRSMIDLFMAPLNTSHFYSDYKFYDINAKVNFRLSQNDRVFLSLYQGRDRSSYEKDSIHQYYINYHVNYGNTAATLRWNHLFSSRLFSNTSLVFNSYFHDVTASDQPYYAELYSGIKDLVVKSDFNWYPNANHNISGGINFLHQAILPATILDRSEAPDSALSILPDQITKKYSNRIAIYAGDEWWLNSKLSLYLGARIPFFMGEDVQYLRFEPRVALLRVINQSTSVKISYTRMHQFLNLIQSYNSAFPAQIWIGSSETVKPQSADEASLGFFKNFSENMFQTSIEVYYKYNNHQSMFREGLSPVISSDLDSSLVFGNGRNYGIELYAGKSRGKLTGWISYTLSYAYQHFDSLNLGKEFPFWNDRRHSLSVSASYQAGRHWFISANFVYASGSPFNYFKRLAHDPYNPLYYDDVTGDAKPGVNNENRIQGNLRLEPYHRLDLGIRYRNETRWGNHPVETEWSLSVYNVYAHKNTFFAYCSIDPETRKPIPVEISFIPVIPSVSFYVKF